MPDLPPLADPPWKRIAMIARWKPVHLGHAAVLAALAAHAEEVVIGIGSSNRHNAKNPFTAAETREMLRLVTGDRPGIAIIDVPDLDDGPRWRKMVVEMLGPLDAYFTANGYVRSLLLADYHVIHPVHLVPPEERVRVDGTMARAAMARGGGEWRRLVPEPVAAHIEETGLLDRFRREFGDEILREAAASPAAAEAPRGADID